jgi:hypothetical protein
LNLKYVLSGIGISVATITIIAILFSSTAENSQDSQESQLPTPSAIPQDSEILPLDVSSETDQISKPVNIQVTKGLKHIVPLDKIRSGGPPKDGIPSIDEPKFAQLSDSNFMSNSDIVIGLEIDGQAKAYPLFIMVWHEIVNDKVGGIPVSVTYCPLCFTNQVFERIIDGKEVEFGTSGKLYNSNLVMYDRLTDSYWSQALGVAITGELTGYELKRIPFDVISWGDWKSLHPETLVLTTETGHLRAYGSDPYGDYYTDPRIIFPVDNKDERMHPKEIILGFKDADVFKAFKQTDVENSTIINDEINGKPVVIMSLFPGNSRAFESTIGDTVLTFDFVDGSIVDLQTNSKWNYDGEAIFGEMEGTQLHRMPFDPGFWFEWVAFHPDTQVYKSG